MPLPLIAAIPAMVGMSWAEIGGATALTALTSFIGHEYKDKPFPLPSFGAPSGLSNVPITLPTSHPVSGAGFVLGGTVAPAVPSIIPKNPNLSKVLDPAFEAFKLSHYHGTNEKSTMQMQLSSKAAAVNTKNAELAAGAGASTFLKNQVEAKSSIDEVAHALNGQLAIHALTFESLERNLGLIAASLAAMVQVQNVAPTVAQAPVVNVQAPVIPDYTVHLEKMAAHAESAKVVSDHAQTIKDVHDLDGELVTRAAPMAITAIHEATKARTATDINSEDFTPDMIPDVSLLLLPFVGSSDIYNPNYSAPSLNPFTHKTIV